jgi:hypothetical protein
MAKIFQLSVFLNFIFIGIALGYAKTYINRKRMIMLFVCYFLVYLGLAVVVLADIEFLVPEP